MQRAGGGFAVLKLSTPNAQLPTPNFHLPTGHGDTESRRRPIEETSVSPCLRGSWGNENRVGNWPSSIIAL
jgi:hypothetical protein